MFPTRILLAADGSENARRAARNAAELSLKLDSELHAVYVAPEYPYTYASRGVRRREDENRYRAENRQTLDGCVELIGEAGGTVVGSHLGTGDAVSEIVELAEELGAGLVLLGSRSRLKRALMGSVSTGVLRHAHCSVRERTDEVFGRLRERLRQHRASGAGHRRGAPRAGRGPRGPRRRGLRA